MSGRLALTLMALVAAYGFGCASGQPQPRSSPPADWVFVGGSLFTRERAEAAAVRDGRVVAVGSRSSLIDHEGEGTRVVDLDGRMLLPGFEDDHLHLDAGSASLAWPDVGEAASADELLALLRVHAGTLPEGAWLRGIGLRRHIAREIPADRLDATFPGRPVVLHSQDAEPLLRSERARASKEPAPEPARQTKLDLIEKGARYVSRFGITSARTSPILWADERELLDELARQGRLPLHVRQDADASHEGLLVDRVALTAHAHPFKISPDWMPVGYPGRPDLRLRSLADDGLELRFGSDWPLSPLDPLAGIAAAVGRLSFDGRPENGWLPEEKLTAAEAVFAYTHRFVEVGGPADLVVLSHDVLKLPEEQLAAAKVEMTMFAGSVVYVSASFAAQIEHNLEAPARRLTVP